MVLQKSYPERCLSGSSILTRVVGNMLETMQPIGLVSAPKAWYDRLREVVRKHGFAADLADEGRFGLRDALSNVIGLLAVHLHHTIGGGTDEFSAIMDEVAKDRKL
jgi:hypothetical protein